MEELTAFDIKILDQLQRDASLSTTELAEKVGLSQSPCWRRLQRLKEEGYIKRQVALLVRRKFGDSVVLFATLKMETLTEMQREDFLRKVDLAPEIQECYSIFGDRDVMIKVVAKSLDWYQKFVFETILKLPGVKDVVSIVTLAEMKYSTSVPIRGRLAL